MWWDSRCRLPQIVFEIASSGRSIWDIPCRDSAKKPGSDADCGSARRQPVHIVLFLCIYFFGLFTSAEHSSIDFCGFFFLKQFTDRSEFDSRNDFCLISLGEFVNQHCAILDGERERLEWNFESRNHVTWSQLPRFSIKTRVQCLRSRLARDKICVRGETVSLAPMCANHFRDL